MAKLRHYRKDLLRPGMFLDQDRQIVLMGEDLVEGAAKEVNRAISNGVRIPVVVGDKHPEDLNESTPGLDGDSRVHGFLDFAGVQNGWLMSDIDTDHELPDTKVSPWVVPKHEVNGEVYRPFIRHVLLTDKPAVSGQGGFALLQSPDGESQCLIKEGEPVGTMLAGGGLAKQLNDAIQKQASVSRSRSKIISEMATEAEITTGTVNEILGGDIEHPPAERLKAFAKVLGLSINSLSEGGKMTSLEKQVKLQLGLGEDVADDVVMATLTERTGKGQGNGGEPVWVAKLRSDLGVEKDEEIISAVAKLRSGSGPEATDSDIPDSVKLQIAQLQESELRSSRREFHHELDQLTAKLSITPAVRDDLKKTFPLESAGGAKLSASEPMDENAIRTQLLTVLGKLPPKHGLTDTKLRGVAGLPVGDGDMTPERAKTESEKSLAAAGMTKKS